MAQNKSITELEEILGINVPDGAYLEIIDTNETDPEKKNKKITIFNLKIATGAYKIFTCANLATSTLQDDNLITSTEKPVTLSSIKQLLIGGTDQVSAGYVESLDNTTGTISFSAGIDYEGAEAILTLG